MSGVTEKELLAVVLLAIVVLMFLTGLALIVG